MDLNPEANTDGADAHVLYGQYGRYGTPGEYAQEQYGQYGRHAREPYDDGQHFRGPYPEGVPGLQTDPGPGTRSDVWSDLLPETPLRESPEPRQFRESWGQPDAPPQTLPDAWGTPGEAEPGADGTALRRPGSDGERAVQRRLGTTERADRFYDEQMLDHLNERMQEFVRRQEMFFLATADRHGECDNTFRAGPPGFLHVVDERTLVYPEYRGNGVHASLGNIQENPHLGILLVDFLQSRIGLHVNGRAEVVEDEEMRAAHPELPVDPVPGRRAQLWVRIEVEEAYIHCAKHIPHLVKAPKRGARDWGTDDYKRKGGDFFGAAHDARERRAADHSRQERTGAGAPAGMQDSSVPATDDPAVWRAHAERLLARARNRRTADEQAPFTGWFG